MHGLKLNDLRCFHCCYLAFIKHSLCTEREWKHIKESQPSKKKAFQYCMWSIDRYTRVVCVGACGYFKYFILQCPDLMETLDFKSPPFYLLQNHVNYTWNVWDWEKSGALTPELWTAVPEARTLLPAGNHLMPWSMRSDYPYHHLSLHRYRCY